MVLTKFHPDMIDDINVLRLPLIFILFFFFVFKSSLCYFTLINGDHVRASLVLLLKVMLYTQDKNHLLSA